MATRTSESIVIEFDWIDSDAETEVRRLNCRATARTSAKTGIEMEALTATSACLLTVYDMLKSVDREMQIDGVRLEEKSGGKSGHFRRE